MSEQSQAYSPSGQFLKAKVNGFDFLVTSHDFWDAFNTNWELDTKELYARYVSPDKTVLDVGAWIGPTVLIGYAHNAKHIYAIEADPLSAYTLKKNCKLSLIDDRVTLINRCIFPTSNEVVSFGNRLEGECSSTCSFGGSRKVLSATLRDIIAENSIDVSQVSIIKIDIEGAELLLVRDLIHLARQTDAVILLSLHQRFWKNIPARPNALSALPKYYDFYTSTEEYIPESTLEEYIKTNMHCMVVLKPKKNI